MRREPVLILFLAAQHALASPFAGPGVNTHGQLLPIDRLRAIGINWVRCDVPVSEMNGERVRAVVRYYRDAGIPQLWIIPQTVGDPAGAARDFVHWGITDIEVGNEPDLADFNPGKQVWSPQRYAGFFREVYNRIRGNARLYGPATSTWNPSYLSAAMGAGAHFDGITYHGYHVTLMANVSDSIKRRLGLPVIVSEVGALDGADPAMSFVAWKRQMGTRAWVYYDGPETDNRGLFSHSDGYRWSRPTGVYNRIRAAVGR